MHFCEKCGNMYYIRLLSDVDSDIVYYCRKCGNEDKTITNNSENICVSKTHINIGSNSYKNVINEYTKLDPTLPRIKNINCPNVDCKSNKEKKRPRL